MGETHQATATGLRPYRARDTVRAAKITGIIHGQRAGFPAGVLMDYYRLELEGGSFVEVGAPWKNYRNPHVGGYYLEDADGGNKRFLPERAFELCYEVEV